MLSSVCQSEAWCVVCIAVRSVVPDAVGGGSGEGLQDVPVEVLHLLLTHLLQAPDHFGVTAAQRAAFLGALRKGQRPPPARRDPDLEFLFGC